MFAVCSSYENATSMRAVTTLARRSGGATSGVNHAFGSIHQYPGAVGVNHPFGSIHQYPGAAALSTASPRPNKNNDDSSILSSATSYLTAFRLRAVSALTTTLTDVEREEILGKLNAVDRSGAEAQAKKSIGEAVAEAQAKEAAASETKWAREREEIERKAERAAQERINHEIALAKAEAAAVTRRREMDIWKTELEAEKAKEVRMEEGLSAIKSSDAQEEGVHPILGRAVVDLGYKRVHTVSARALAAVPIWEKQRVYRHERARTMASDKTKSLDTGLPGIITLHEDADGQLSILDGQHRVGMMAILEDKKEQVDDSLLDLDRILVEVFPNLDPESRPKHAEDIFVEINKAEPVKLVDLPGVAKGSERKIIDGAADSLRNKYPDMFKPSQRCRAPHLNLDNLRDALFASDVLKRHSIKSDKALLNWMEEKNMEMAARFAEQGANGSKTASKNVSKSSLAKAEKFQFFLGLDSSWLYQ